MIAAVWASGSGAPITLTFAVLGAVAAAGAIAWARWADRR